MPIAKSSSEFSFDDDRGLYAFAEHAGRCSKSNTEGKRFWIFHHTAWVCQSKEFLFPLRSLPGDERAKLSWHECAKCLSLFANSKRNGAPWIYVPICALSFLPRFPPAKFILPLAWRARIDLIRASLFFCPASPPWYMPKWHRREPCFRIFRQTAYSFTMTCVII